MAVAVREGTSGARSKPTAQVQDREDPHRGNPRLAGVQWTIMQNSENFRLEVSDILQSYNVNKTEKIASMS